MSHYCGKGFAVHNKCTDVLGISCEEGSQWVKSFSLSFVVCRWEDTDATEGISGKWYMVQSLTLNTPRLTLPYRGRLGWKGPSPEPVFGLHSYPQSLNSNRPRIDKVRGESNQVPPSLGPREYVLACKQCGQLNTRMDAYLWLFQSSNRPCGLCVSRVNPGPAYELLMWKLGMTPHCTSC